MPELGLIKHLLKYDNYLTYFSSIPKDHLKNQYREVWYIYQAVDELLSLTGNDITLPELQTFFFHKFPDADREIYTTLFDKLVDSNISDSVAHVLLSQIKERKVALSLSEAAFKFSTGISDRTAVQEAIDGFSNGPVDKEAFEFVSDDLEYLLNETVHKRGLRWRLDFLNKSLGSLRKGNFGFLFARPETGKTTFLASEVSHMLTQLTDDSGPIIWFNNEQEGKEVMIRLYQAYFGVRLDQLMANFKKYRDEFRKQVKGRFLLVDDANIHRTQVEKLLKEHEPCLMVFDQIDKVKGFAADREDLRLGAIYIWNRELAKEYAPSIAVCQAGFGDGQKWLTMDDVANAKTSKQAEADWILGIGMTHADGAEYVRYLNISKNKLAGDEDTIAAMRHAKGEVIIRPEIARYEDTMKYA